MPKKVDHRARRTQIADALMRVAATRGLEAVSLRHVATEAGVSAGMVQHYFGTKDEMMTFALEVVSENVQARLTADIADLGQAPPPRSLLRALLVQLLPLDEQRMLEGGVALAFQAYAVVKPSIATGLHANTAGMRAFVAGLIRTEQASSDAAARVDPGQAATILFALIEGLGVHVLGGHYSADVALAAFDAHLDALFGPAKPDDDRHRD